MAGQRWARLDVDYFENRKTMHAGRDARELHLRSICWAARHLTDGGVAPEAAELIARAAGLTRRQREAAEELLLVNRLWVPAGDGYEIHDFLDFNPSRAEVEAERESMRERQRRARAKRGEITP